MWLVDDFRDFKYMSRLFENDTTHYIGTLAGYDVKKSTDLRSIYYGLFLDDELVGYDWLMKFGISNPRLYRGHEFHIADKLKGQGLGTLVYEMIIVTEGIILVSDATHTVPTAKIWQKLMKKNNLEVGTYDSSIDKLRFGQPIDIMEVYNNSHMHFAARA